MSEETKTIQGQEKEMMQFEGERTRDRRCYIPRTDIYETEDAVYLALDMPGVDEKSVDVTLEKNILSISGLVTPPTYDGYSPAYTEYDLGDFQRSFTIQMAMDVNAIEAHLKNGVLNVRLPKAESNRVKKVEIRAG